MQSSVIKTGQQYFYAGESSCGRHMHDDSQCENHSGCVPHRDKILYITPTVVWLSDVFFICFAKWLRKGKGKLYLSDCTFCLLYFVLCVPVCNLSSTDSLSSTHQQQYLDVHLFVDTGSHGPCRLNLALISSKTRPLAPLLKINSNLKG